MEDSTQSDRFNQAIGERIKEMRAKCKLSVGEMAAKIGVSPSQLYRYEAGNTSIGPMMLYRMASIFKCEPSELLDGIPL